MSRTRKGTRGPGWEPWGCRTERQEQQADYIEEDPMISRAEVLMGRDIEYPLTHELNDNLDRLLTSLNEFRILYGLPMLVSSGYRPGHYNKEAHGAPNSSHVVCEACDFHDPTGAIDAYAYNNRHLLEQCGLYLEDPAHTPGWCHLTIRAPLSGSRVFVP